jgi:hypothetical protein
MTLEELTAALAAKDAEVAALAAKAKELETANVATATKAQELETAHASLHASYTAKVKAEVARKAGWPDALASDLQGKNEAEWEADAKRRIALLPKSGAPAPVPGVATVVPAPDNVSVYRAKFSRNVGF